MGRTVIAILKHLSFDIFKTSQQQKWKGETKSQAGGEKKNAVKVVIARCLLEAYKNSSGLHKQRQSTGKLEV